MRERKEMDLQYLHRFERLAIQRAIHGECQATHNPVEVSRLEAADTHLANRDDVSQPLPVLFILLKTTFAEEFTLL